MDILDIFGTFYLNHLSPLWGYFSDLGFLSSGVGQVGVGVSGVNNYSLYEFRSIQR